MLYKDVACVYTPGYSRISICVQSVLFNDVASVCTLHAIQGCSMCIHTMPYKDVASVYTPCYTMIGMYVQFVLYKDAAPVCALHAI